MDQGGIDYIVERYNDIYDLLVGWGYEVVPDPDFDAWQEIVRDSGLTGHVKLTGTKDIGDGERLTLKFEEFWVKGNRGDEAVLVREDGSLLGYYYHGQAPNGGMRWCVDPLGHADNPRHVHPFASPEGGDAIPCEPVSAEQALEAFELQAFLDENGPSNEE